MIPLTLYFYQLWRDQLSGLNLFLSAVADFRSKEMRVRQRAVALYFIDKLALRAGNEKDEDQADTVGCCSLRVEHITLHEVHDGEQLAREAAMKRFR